MLVVSYSDFAANMNKYLPAASVSGLKILPQKKEKKNSRHLKFMQAVEAASGVLPSDIDIEKEKTEAILKV
ncbi:hypothetical protein II906_05765 [bacterium]|nr:hypothetical protein [bacterium]